mmetsp:Transcript_95233/g.213285  ORF Transcript_95233/g.213285 Transcript_95233/m.213285 type:complete len:277 (-) Transcript_95233:1339-2169(-)
MAQPACRARLKFTRQSVPKRFCIAGCRRYSANKGDWWRQPRMVVKATTDISAMRALRGCGSASSLMSSKRQMTRKLSPLFLFGAPWNSSAMPCTISAIWLQNVLIFACSTSVVMLKSRTRTTPMMVLTAVPGIIALMPTPVRRMLWAMMLAPASPNPRASNDPSLMMVFSRITVSKGSSPPALHMLQKTRSWMKRFPRSKSRFRRAFATSSALNSSSAIFMATSGLSRMASTLATIFSTGRRMRVLASCANIIDPRIRSTITKSVTRRLYLASVCT